MGISLVVNFILISVRVILYLLLKAKDPIVFSGKSKMAAIVTLPLAASSRCYFVRGSRDPLAS